MIRVTLYSRDGCGLCEEAKHLLYQLDQRVGLVVREIDIEANPEIEKAYFDKIPVIEIGEARLYAPIDPQQLEQFVRREGQNQ